MFSTQTLFDFTVAIITYNGAERFPLVLEKLQLQINLEKIKWEILVIDNNSTDNTAQILSNYDVRYVVEKRQGSAYARQKAIWEAKSPLVGFLDDDNLPEPNWVASAYEFAQKHPRAGAFGSQIHPEYETTPPVDFKRIESFLAITKRGEKPLLYNARRRLLPPSAGLVVRRQAWLNSVPEKCILPGVVGNGFLRGEDLEILTYIQKAGWEIWYNPQMKILHKIPSSRLTPEYLIPLLGAIGLSRYITRTLCVNPWLKPWLVMAYCSNDLRKLCCHLLKYGLIESTDIVTMAERELLLKTWLSPMYFAFDNPIKKIQS